MRVHVYFIVMLIVLLVGCQTALRKYDGVLGYTITSNVQGQISISYIDEERRSWDDIKKRARLACVHELKNDPRTVSITVLKQEQFSQQVDMAISIPIGAAPTGDFKANASSGKGLTAIVSSSNMNQTLMRNMKLKKLTAKCSNS